jgi:hypothetical protein
MINIDQVDQATIYLSKTGLDVEIITSSAIGVNVTFLHARVMIGANSESEGGG